MLFVYDTYLHIVCEEKIFILVVLDMAELANEALEGKGGKREKKVGY